MRWDYIIGAIIVLVCVELGWIYFLMRPKQ